MPPRDFRDVVHREQHAGFVVGPHRGDHSGVWLDRTIEIVEVKVPFSIHWHERDCASALREVFAITPCRAVLDCCRHDVLALRIELQR